MKKESLSKLFLMLLPLGALGLATTSNSVTVFDPATGAASVHSYFALADQIPMQMAAPMAALLTLASGILAAVYLWNKKSGCLKAIRVTAFLAATSAVLPVMVQTQVKVLPNPVLPLLMMIHAVLAHFMAGKPQVKQEQPGPRLEIH